MRMIRDSPPELARAFAGPYLSTRRTLSPFRRRLNAVQAPKQPAPITATSQVFIGAHRTPAPTALHVPRNWLG